MGQDALAPAQGHSCCQYVEYRELNDTGCHGQVLFGIFGNAEIDTQVTRIGQRRTFGCQCDNRGLGGSRELRGLDQTRWSSGM